MIQKYLSVVLKVEKKGNIIRRKTDGCIFGKRHYIRLDNDSVENYEEVASKRTTSREEIPTIGEEFNPDLV